ncbi:hypothetical protein [Planococcus halocryophilus]|uniref:hypothetical protein n=1 Tax=Planococcus halocryophilus TaxID=1215089 RepID=UPI001F0E82C7|nr:hypothetical protein [Planococcus halocryophilus]MCH4828063.1 hypothetical protein [Planococcus halocryophilus]
MNNKELKHLKADYHLALYSSHSKIGKDIVIQVLEYDTYSRIGWIKSNIVSQEELEYILS